MGLFCKITKAMAEIALRKADVALAKDLELQR
jgi:hypothetical protein